MPTFQAPVSYERVPTDIKPFKYYQQPVSFAVVWRNSHFQSIRAPHQEETDALVEGVTWFTGGRVYTISQATADLLTADGFAVLP